jgi:hypothetical protein
MTATSPRKLTIADIADARAYEREREEFREHVKALKRLRRIGVGPFVTLVFENRDTIRFQVQEMARVERIHTDEGIQTELDIYNPLIPEPGNLAATLFIELVDEGELRLWLPELVGIERSVELRVGEGPDAKVVPCIPEAAHEAQLTREEVTASVHYITFEFTPSEVEAFASAPVTLAVTHPRYSYETVLGEATVAELLTDLRP